MFDLALAGRRARLGAARCGLLWHVVAGRIATPAVSFQLHEGCVGAYHKLNGQISTA
jgi:hypothetical protein